MSDMDTDPVELEEPKGKGKSFDPPEGIWIRGLIMIVMAVMFAFAESLLILVAVVQFFWMLFSGNKNTRLAQFGGDLGKWMAHVAEFQSAASEEKPFPWAKWGA